VFVIILIGYSYRHALQALPQRIFHDLWPAHGEVLASGAIRFPLSDNGHFMIEASAEGVPIRFMLDTGASRVVLSKEDAKRIGIDVSALTFNQPTSTANGMVLSAPITIHSLSVGPIHVYNVRAAVNGSDLDGSLLGMSFLEKIKKYEVSNGQLVLYN
jgi:aspartyl protease family protein